MAVVSGRTLSLVFERNDDVPTSKEASASVDEGKPAKPTLKHAHCWLPELFFCRYLVFLAEVAQVFAINLCLARGFGEVMTVLL